LHFTRIGNFTKRCIYLLGYFKFHDMEILCHVEMGSSEENSFAVEEAVEGDAAVAFASRTALRVRDAAHRGVRRLGVLF